MEKLKLKSMRLNAPKGQKVYFTCAGGTANDMEFACKTLTLDSDYTVEDVIVGKWHSGVILKEYPDQKFNTCLFEEDQNNLLQTNESITARFSRTGGYL